MKACLFLTSAVVAMLHPTAITRTIGCDAFVVPASIHASRRSGHAMSIAYPGFSQLSGSGSDSHNASDSDSDGERGRNHVNAPLSKPTQASQKSRRRLFNDAASIALAATLMVPQAASAATAESATAATFSDIVLRTKNIPTFCIVTSAGIPYMIFNGSASATGYFFLSYNLAQQTLQDAIGKDTSENAAEWKQAKILVIPLAISLQLALRNTQRKAVNNGILFSTYNDIVASEEGIKDARIYEEQQKRGALTGITANTDKWSQKGRVPIFSIEGLTITKPDGTVKSPRYFNRRDLISEWLRQRGGDEGAVEKLIQVTDLVDLFRKSIASNNLAVLDSIELVPVAETNEVAKSVAKATPSDLRYNFKEVVLVQSSK